MKNKVLQNNTQIFLIYAFIFFGIVLRFLPHPANFAPIGALALFSGAKIKGWQGLIVPLLALFISDIFLGFYSWQVMVCVYGGFAIMMMLGRWAGKRKWYYLLPACLTGSIIFFIVTNLAVWAFTPLYLKRLPGLIHCYVMALPFFRNSLSGDIIYSGLLFGLWSLAQTVVKYSQLKLRRVWWGKY